jgi:hypothetical protein
MAWKRKIAVLAAATGIAGIVLGKELSSKDEFLILGGVNINYHSDITISTMEVNYHSGTQETYVDFLNDSRVDLITIVDAARNGTYYYRNISNHEPIVRLGQTVLDKYLAEIRKRKTPSRD